MCGLPKTIPIDSFIFNIISDIYLTLLRRHRLQSEPLGFIFSKPSVTTKTTEHCSV